MNALREVSRILSNLPEEGHHPSAHDAGIIVGTLSGMTPDQLRALAVLSNGHAILDGMIETELKSRPEASLEK